MSFGDLAAHAAMLWIIAAVVLGIAELLVPGVFLIFLAIAAGVVGIVTLAMPDLPIAAQLGAFGAWSIVSVLIGRRWYADHPVATNDPLLNDRSARIVGEIVVVTEAIVGGRGRVRVGDGEWPASGPDAEVGARMRVVAVKAGIVELAAI